MRTFPVGDCIRLLEDGCTDAVVRLTPDQPKGAGPVLIATSSGPAIASVPADHWATEMCREMFAVVFPCFVPCLAREDELEWPWVRLRCDTCDGGRGTCRHVRAVVDTIPGMRGRWLGDCHRMAVYPTREVGGAIADGHAEQCAVCMETVPAGAALSCCHCEKRFHRGCIERWLESGARARCPLCRETWPTGIRWLPLWCVRDAGALGLACA